MASSTNPKTIHLAPEEIRHQKEGIAVGIITPGQLIERLAGRTLQRHSTAGGLAQLSFALECDWFGRTIDDDYQPAAVTGETVGDQVRYYVGRNGDEIYALVDAGESIADAEFLSSAGNGNLRGAQANDAIVAQSLETVDNSAGTSPARVRVELMICCQGYSS